jgi:hypothetical protein
MTEQNILELVIKARFEKLLGTEQLNQKIAQTAQQTINLGQQTGEEFRQFVAAELPKNIPSSMTQPEQFAHQGIEKFSAKLWKEQDGKFKEVILEYRDEIKLGEMIPGQIKHIRRHVLGLEKETSETYEKQLQGVVWDSEQFSEQKERFDLDKAFLKDNYKTLIGGYEKLNKVLAEQEELLKKNKEHPRNF